MFASLPKDQKTELVSSLRRYFTEELDTELSDLQAGPFLEYLFNEIAPLAYNQGAEDARKFMLSATEDLPGTCFQEALTFWKRKGSREVRRKPNG